jgi:hemimethylated DNA binding protein
MFYNAYVSEQNLVVEQSPKQVNHPDISFYFAEFDGKRYQLNKQRVN